MTISPRAGIALLSSIALLFVPTSRAASPLTPSRAESAPPEAGSANRVVHRFDFDERDEGNLEDVPRYWEPLHMPGFPRFAKAEFDSLIGHDRPPSFHLIGQGRSVGYSYAGVETRILPSNDYRIEAFIRTANLEHARACFSACFVSESGQAITGTLARSRYIGGADERDEWTRVELVLLSAPAEAASVGLQVWLLQDSAWNMDAALKRISLTDVHAQVWLDDVNIYVLPHVELTVSTVGNVLGPQDPQELHITLKDQLKSSVRAQLRIFDAAGGTVLERNLHENEHEDASIPLNGLGPGLYRAELDLSSESAGSIQRALTFAKLAGRPGAETPRSRTFGVVVDAHERGSLEAESTLLQRQGIRSAKLPVTYDANTSVGSGRAAVRQPLAQELAKSGFALTGIVSGVSVDSRGSNEKRSPQLADIAAASASIFQGWQLEAERANSTRNDGSSRESVEALRAALSNYITLPQISAVMNSETALSQPQAAAEQLTLTFGNSLASTELFQQLRAVGYSHVSAFVEPLSESDYERIPRLADWAIRVITARHAGASTVFVPQTWRSRVSAKGVLTEPVEEYVVLHTIAGMLGDAPPGPSMEFGDGLHAKSFYAGDSAVIALWDSSAPSNGREHHLQLGRASKAIDMWGCSTPLTRDEKGRQIITVGPDPVFIQGVERWLIDLAFCASITPAFVEGGQEIVRHVVEFNYKGEKSVAGQATIRADESLEVVPRTFAFHVAPGAKETLEFQSHFGHHESAGRKEYALELTLDQSGYYLEIPLTCELGISNIDIRGLAVVEGNDLLLRHLMSNHGASDVNFRGTASVPGRERQSKPFTNVHPGETQVVEYRFENGRELIGRYVRLSLREMNDGPRVHNLELNVP